MYYEINVSKKVADYYNHYFATAPRSLSGLKEAGKMYQHFKLLFPAPEYKITVKRVPETSEYIDPKSLEV